VLCPHEEEGWIFHFYDSCSYILGFRIIFLGKSIREVLKKIMIKNPGT